MGLLSIQKCCGYPKCLSHVKVAVVRPKSSLDALVVPRYLGWMIKSGVWMIILVPVDGENGYRSYARSVAEMVDDMGEERRKLESGQRAGFSRGTYSIDGDSIAGSA
jgi:hypothetical protein